MKNTSYSKLQKYLEILFLGLLIMQCCLIISGSLFGLLSSSDDCSNPIRAWLIANACVEFTILIIYCIWKLPGFIFWCIWNVVWGVIGAIWAFGDKDCENQFESGYATTGVMLSSSFFVLTLILFAGCIGGIALCIGYGIMNNYEDIE